MLGTWCRVVIGANSCWEAATGTQWDGLITHSASTANKTRWNTDRKGCILTPHLISVRGSPSCQSFRIKTLSVIPPSPSFFILHSNHTSGPHLEMTFHSFFSLHPIHTATVLCQTLVPCSSDCNNLLAVSPWGHSVSTCGPQHTHSSLAQQLLVPSLVTSSESHSLPFLALGNLSLWTLWSYLHTCLKYSVKCIVIKGRIYVWSLSMSPMVFGRF
jgi:hypothetical protein